MSKWISERKAVLDAARKMSDKGFVVGTAGNVSMRLAGSPGKGLMAITPSTRYRDTIGVDDIAVVDFDGQRVEGDISPSVEIMMHIGIYKARKKVNAVIHCHPPLSSSFAVAGKEIPPVVEDQVTYLGGAIKVAEYAISGSQDLVKHSLAALGPRNAVLLANHGVVCVGKDMRETFTNCEMLEKTAKIYLCVLSMGKPKPIPAESLEALSLFYNYVHGDGE